MAELGMDADLVEQAGRQLKSQAASIQSLIAQLDRTVNGLTSIWQGQDATQFVTQWWPQHKKSLQAAQQHVDGLGQSALNNASEQRQASGGGSGGAVSGGGSGGGGASATNATQIAADAAARAVHGNSIQSHGLNNFLQKWEGKPINADNAYGAQCFDVFRQYSNDVAGAHGGYATGSNAASDIYKQYDSNGVSQFYDRIPVDQGPPQPGDVIVYDGAKANGGYGHVAVVTEVDGNNYKVLEQNYSGYRGPVDLTHGPNDPAIQRSHTFDEKGGGKILGYLRPKQITNV